jgi:hypothetical protein
MALTLGLHAMAFAVLALLQFAVNILTAGASGCLCRRAAAFGRGDGGVL